MKKTKLTPKTGKRQIVTVAEAKKSDRKRSTVAPNIQYDRIMQKYIVELYSGMRDGKADRKHESYKTLQEAKDRLTEHKESIRKGKQPSSKPKMTLGECIDEFISNAQIEATTAYGYRVIEKRIKTSPLYKISIANIKKSDIYDYRAFVQKNTSFKNSTINKDMELIHRVLSYAVSRDYILNNPADSIKKLREESFEPQPLSIEEMNTLCQEVEQSGDWQLIIPVYLGLYQGLRRGEIAGLKWDMISFDDNIIKIKQTITQVGGKVVEKPPKTENSERTLDMFLKVREMLLQYREYQIQNKLFNDYVVINGKGEHISPTHLSNKFNRFISKKGLRKIRFHDLRHTYGTRAISAGVNPLSVSGAMGHSKLSTTLNIYVHSKDLDGSKEVNAGLRKIFG